MPQKQKTYKPPKFNLKTYNVPANCHYLLIQEPWPYHISLSDSPKQQANVNAVVGWVYCMVRDLCDCNINPSNIRIFSQSTHRHLIVELYSSSPDKLNLHLLLGAHHSSAFLTPKYAGQDNRTSILYEYDYVRFNSPEKTNWTSYTATYETLPPEFAIRHEDAGFPYPTPSPADGPRHKLAKPLPSRLILGHPDSIQQTPTPLTDPLPPANQPVEPLTTPSREQTRQPSIPNSRSLSLSRSRSPSPPPPPEAPRSEFAFTPYERPLHFPADKRTTRSSSPAAPAPTRIKRDPHEEEEDALQSLRAPQTAVAPGVRIKSEIKTEEYRPSIKMEDKYLDEGTHRVKSECETEPYQSTVKKEELYDEEAAMRARDAGGVRVKQEVPIKAEYVAGPELQDLHTKGRQAMRERALEDVKHEQQEVKIESERSDLGVKPEPVDVPMPKPRPFNRSFDPFDGYGPDFGYNGIKKEEDSNDFNSRQLAARSSYASPSAHPRPSPPRPRVKQEEIERRPPPPHVKHEYVSSEEYSEGRSRSRGNWEPPPPSAFSRDYSDSSRRYFNSGSGSRDRNYGREASRTLSLSPRPVKRERDTYDGDRQPIHIDSLGMNVGGRAEPDPYHEGTPESETGGSSIVLLD
ncbi:hypothetical protein MSAN_01489500 [Mycena sanguinolenta]|uniref:Uncharacterized protein n=1 Tax=Mycena sanguinolenta TaxID=230812 RepID=A0A8H6YC90_9AGAR|nr:hypothetical protein MSAN_01489500 [Mycena sanguinolenta]